MVIAIKSAKYLGDYKIQLLFSDKTKRVIDFRTFLSNALNPMTSQYVDKQKFSSFRIKYGDIVWGDYEMYFPIWDLHEGKL